MIRTQSRVRVRVIYLNQTVGLNSEESKMAIASKVLEPALNPRPSSFDRHHGTAFFLLKSKVRLGRGGHTLAILPSTPLFVAATISWGKVTAIVSESLFYLNPRSPHSPGFTPSCSFA